ncbi:MAG: hypothetical protein EOO50_15275 [Flavobacterium sp.]|uniref:energy transducer TonB n=1 Tax=Flavobacterium sp. TaxID=239 RepID=UPI001220F68A|nr:energy transducer TonB [Flavobacterium sp.]RZJ64562.1 MAG: hypothetical protein EOO50_15275 [Flavobacterium sp.]
MKHIFGVFALLLCLSAFGQDNLAYFDEQMRPADASGYFYKRLISATDTVGRYSVQVYDRNGNLAVEGFSSIAEYPKFEGKVTEYFPSGKIKSEKRYTDGQILGAMTEWYENGQKKSVVEHLLSIGVPQMLIHDFWKENGEQTVVNGNGHFYNEGDFSSEEGSVKNSRYDGVIIGRSKTSPYTYEETYVEGKFLKGKSTGADGTREYDILEQKPEFEGGTTEFYKYIGSNYRLPRRYSESGRIVISFVVEKDGSLSDIKLMKGLSEKLDQEALRVVADSPKWRPAMQRGRVVRCAFSLPIVIPKP